MDYVISSRDTLERLRSDSTIKRCYRRIKIDIEFNNSDLQGIEKKINSHYFSCGCISGAIGVYVAIIVILIIWLVFPWAINWIWWKIAAVLFLASFAGKVIGLIASRYFLNRALLKLESVI